MCVWRGLIVSITTTFLKIFYETMNDIQKFVHILCIKLDEYEDIYIPVKPSS